MNLKKGICLAMVIAFCNVIKINAQELRCVVSINSQKITTSDRNIFSNMQQVIAEFMNNTRWTTDKFKSEERIDCSLNIIIDTRPSNNEFTGSIQITANRPVYKSTYNSPLMNIKDDKFQFKFVEFQQLEWNENGSNTNLVNVLAFYAFMILGFDYDSYSPLGGTVYFSKAQVIVNNSANVSEPGWRAFESDRNRYWLCENINAPLFKPVRELMYKMHRKGLDEMTKDQPTALRTISESILPLKKIQQTRPTSWLLQNFCYAKSDEIINIFKGEPVPPDMKNTVKLAMQEIDIANASKYDAITQ